MKTLKYKLFILLIAGIFFQANNALAQCDSDDFLDNCSELLDDYTFMKSFEVKTDNSMKSVTYKSVLSRDHNYILTVCNGNTKGKKMIVNLYDRDKKLITSSYYKPKNLHVNKIGFQCTATGVYYIEVYFEDDDVGCGVTILGFKK